MTPEQVRDLLTHGKLVVHGKEVTLDRKFVFFLYGQCANESMGIDMGSLRITGTDVVIENVIPTLNVMNFKLETTKFNV